MSIIRVLKSRIVEAACRTDFMSFVQSAFQILDRFDAEPKLASLCHSLLSRACAARRD